MSNAERKGLRRPEDPRPAAEGGVHVRPDGRPSDRRAGVTAGLQGRERSAPLLRAARRERAAPLRALGRGFLSMAFAFARLAMAVATRVCFRRVDILARERFPARGAVLVVANHPATWTDVVVLDVALGRKLQFIAHEALFRPWARGVVLDIFASLPVWHRDEDPESEARNRETFARCRARLDAGDAIAIFPEGVSGGDRDLLPLKTGLARFLLDPVAGPPRPLIPVAIHYEDRTAFRTAVVVAVGDPLPVRTAPPVPGDHEEFVHELTDRIAAALRAVLATAAAHARAAWSGPVPGRPPGAAGVIEPIARVFAAGGMVLHATPRVVIESLVRRWAHLPQQLAFVRMVTGLFLIPAWYALLTALAAALGGRAWFAIPLAAPVLGILACRELDRRRRGTRPRERGGEAA